MSVVTRLSAAFCLLIVVLAGLLIYQVRTNRAAVSASYELAAISSRLSVTNSRQIAAINQLEEAAGKYRVTRDAGYLQLFDQAYENFETGLRGLDLEPRTSGEREEIDALSEAWAAFHPSAEALSAGESPDADIVAMTATFAALRQQTRRLMDASQAAMSERLEASASASVRAERVSWIVGAGTLLLTVLVFTLLVRSISGGLTRLQKGTHQVASGNFEYRLPTDGGDEFSQLAHDFNIMTRRLGELDRMKRSFISKVSHDLKTPLASMRETVQVMLDGVAGPVTERQRRLLHLTDQSADRLSSMIVKILDLSAIEAGAVALEIGEHRAEALFDSALDAFAIGDRSRRDRIVVERPVPPILVTCDRDRTLQVLVNLLENAVKFSADDSLVGLSVRLAEPRTAEALSANRYHRSGNDQAGALIEVADRGRGVSTEDKRKVFEHFYQSNGGRPAPGSGVGLGLAICREIVELHGGAIWVRDNPDGGSIFGVFLPRARIQAPVPAAAEPAHVGSA